MTDADSPDRLPRTTRFRKGQSGNPRGRPRKRPDPQPSAFDVVIDRTLTIVQGGVERQVTVEEALQHKTCQEAIAGSSAARRQVLKMIAKREQAITGRTPPRGSVERRIEHGDPRNADEAMLILGIARHDPRWTEPVAPDEPERLLLEPWAVRAALARRSGTKLARREIDEARRCTHDAASIRWPEAEEP